MYFKFVFKMFTSSRVGRHITRGVIGITGGGHRRGASQEGVIVECHHGGVIEGHHGGSGEKIVNIRCWISSVAEGLQKDVKGPWAELAGTP